MNVKVFSVGIVGFLFVAIVFLFSFKIASPAEKTRGLYLVQMDVFIKELQQFHAMCSSIGIINAKKKEKIKKAYFLLRKKYASVEWLFEYLDPEAAKNYVNGAPLPRVLYNAANMEIVEPEGLQCIDELVFTSSEDFDLNELLSKLTLLKDKMTHYCLVHQNSKLSDRMVIEAMRFQLVKIFTLKITGFDTPSSLQGIQDAASSLEAMNHSLVYYDQLIDTYTSIKALELHTEFKKAIICLSLAKDFNAFDRVYFYRNNLSLLYEKLLLIQQQSGIEFYEEVVKFPSPFNYRSKNLFDIDFIKSDFYQNIPVGKNKQQLSQLGKVLFFDPLLSSNNKRSCASCHNPVMAFSDAKQKSLAFDFQGNLNRNAPGLINSVFSDRYFGDLRANTLEDQIDHVVADQKEFHTSYSVIERKLKLSAEYIDLFKKSFPELGKDPINEYSISNAISAYVGSLVSINSPFDRYMRKELEAIDQEVIQGANLFMGKAKCATCHFSPLFNGLVPPYYKENESEVLGVTVDDDFKHPVLDTDVGRSGGQLKENTPIYNHSFKTPTIRNVEYTAPYMHNGAYKDLKKVMDFYNAGGGKGLGLDIFNQTLPEDSLGLSEKEINALIVFMNSLSDTTGLTDKPVRLPLLETQKELNNRVIGGEY